MRDEHVIDGPRIRIEEPRVKGHHAAVVADDDLGLLPQAVHREDKVGAQAGEAARLRVAGERPVLGNGQCGKLAEVGIL